MYFALQIADKGVREPLSLQEAEIQAGLAVTSGRQHVLQQIYTAYLSSAGQTTTPVPAEAWWSHSPTRKTSVSVQSSQAWPAM